MPTRRERPSPLRIAQLYRYPVKGLSAEPLDRAVVKPGETLPRDRAWAVENGAGRFDAAHPQHVHKTSFLMLMRNERLAGIQSQFDEATETLTILRAGRPVCRGRLPEKSGRAVIEQFLSAWMEKDLRGPPRIVHAEGHSFSDTVAKCLHVITLASVRRIEREIGRPVDPLRFRPNIVVEGAEPWAEFDWVGRDLRAGSVRLHVFKRTYRCAATTVDPQTGRRDMDIPAVLARRWGHTDFGVYAKLLTGGELAVGGTLIVL